MVCVGRRERAGAWTTASPTVTFLPVSSSHHLELVHCLAGCDIAHRSDPHARDQNLILVHRVDVLGAQPTFLEHGCTENVNEQAQDPVGRNHAVRDDSRQPLLLRVVVVVMDGRRLRMDSAVVKLHRVLDIDVPAHALARHGPRRQPELGARFESHLAGKCARDDLPPPPADCAR